ncbi:TAF5-like RNA polymerase II p300/CBP-associated factor-associated factor 65 kDa subunit 5L isoform X2 [Dermacentor variabilis]|uniref:TAF5-like RNA polymerase II p300/CBP-associated factor-associated factor 65 kDa subunit 5L isoform X2 n=1 Tax=Dermacentor variabilis TaxID=34621 RepID=UPI003F5AF272
MKKNRSEMVAAAVGRYLKGRQYMDCDSFKKADVKLQQSVADFALNGTVASETGAKNVLSYSPVNKDAQAVEQQFSKLKNFIADACEPFKSELTFILFPVFVHLYLELITNGQKSSAQKFHSRHRTTFLSSDQYRMITDMLPSITSASDVPSHPHVKEFRENKYSVKLSDDSLEYVLNFLRDSDNLILLQVFNLHIDIDVQLPYEKMNGDAQALGPQQHLGSSTAARGISVDTKQTPSAELCKESLTSLRQAIKNVKEGAPCIPSICLYTVNDRLSGDSKLLRGHSGPVYGLDFLPGKELMLSCSEDTTVRAWSLKTHSNVAIYRGHSYPVWDIDIGPLGLYFATASKDSTAKIWTLERTYPLRILAGHNMDVDCVKFHPNSNYVATGSSDRCLRLWSVQDGRVVRSLPAHRGTIFALAFSPDGQLLASAGEDRRIKVWDLGSSTLLKELRGHTDTVYSISFSRDGSVLASGGAEPLVHLWDLRGSVGSSPSDADPNGHMSPEHLASFPTSTSALHLVRYAPRSLLTLAGSAAAGSGADISSVS